MENLTQLLEKLACNLGTTVEYLWSVLIKQAYISGIISLMWIAIALIGTFFWFRGVWYVRKNWDKLYANGIETWFVPMLVVIIFVLAIIFVGAITNALAAFFNPEYWALQNVLETIK